MQSPFPALIAVLLCLLSAVYADTTGTDVPADSVYADLEAAEIPEFATVVVSHRIPAQITPSQRILKASDFQGRYPDLPSVLESVSGIDIKSTGGYGQYAEASIRGASGKGLRVYLDGVLLNSPSGGAVDLGKIPLDRIQEIRIVKNGGNLSSMGEGMGAMIELITDSRLQICTAHLEAGSFGLFKAGALIRKKLGTFTHQLNFDYSRSDNDYPFVHDNGTTIPTRRNPDPAWDDTLMHKSNNQFSSLGASYNLSWDIDENQQISQRISVSSTDEGLFVYYYKDNQSGSIHNRVFTSTTGFERAITQKTFLNTELSGQYRRSLFSDPEGHYDLGGKSRELESEQKRGEMSLTLSYQLYDESALELFTAGRYEKHTQQNTALADRPTMDRREARAGLGTVLEYRDALLKTRFLYKYEQDSSSAGLGYWSPRGRRFVLHYPSAEASVEYPLTKSLKLYLSASSSRRSPTFYERFGWGNGFVSNPELAEETRHEADAGVLANRNGTSLSFSLFRGRVYDKIKSIPRNSFVKVMNFADTDFSGAELEMKTRLLSLLLIEGSATYLNSTVLSAEEPGWVGKTEPFIPRYTFCIKLELEKGVFTAGHDVRYESSCYTSTDNLTQKDAQTQLGAWAGVKFLSEFRLQYKIDNYMNSASFDFLDNPKPRRTHFISLQYTL